MVGRQFLLFIFQDEGEEEGIAGAPYATFTVEEAFDTALYLFTFHIEAAERQGATIVQFEVTSFISFFSDEDIRFTFQVEGVEAIAIAFGLGFVFGVFRRR